MRIEDEDRQSYSHLRTSPFILAFLTRYNTSFLISILKSRFVFNENELDLSKDTSRMGSLTEKRKVIFKKYLNELENV